MTTRTMVIYAVATVWCAATAVKAAIALAHRESYVVSWWDAGVVSTGRKLGRARTAIKLITMIAIATTCALALAHVLESPVPLYIVFGAIGVTAVSEMSAPKPQRKR